jgi:hypothetical protein
MNQDNIPDEPEELQQPPAETFDMSKNTPVEHRYDKIIGNELLCTLHENAHCPVIYVKPTEILVRDEEGTLHLYNNMPK